STILGRASIAPCGATLAHLGQPLPFWGRPCPFGASFAPLRPAAALPGQASPFWGSRCPFGAGGACFGQALPRFGQGRPFPSKARRGHLKERTGRPFDRSPDFTLEQLTPPSAETESFPIRLTAACSSTGFASRPCSTARLRRPA